jgi:hypothetical protein
MKTDLELWGISLQTAMGAIIILDQIEHNFLDHTSKWMKEKLSFISEQRKRRSLTVILIALVMLLAIVFLANLTQIRVNSAVIAGLVLFCVMGYDIYLISLGSMGIGLVDNDGKKNYLAKTIPKKLILYDQKAHSPTIPEGLSALAEKGKLIPYNLILFFTSIIGLFLFVEFLTHSHVISVQGWSYWLALLTFSFFFALSIIGLFPVAILSFLYLAGEFTIWIIALLRFVKKRPFWIFVLLVWLVGGIFSLVSRL